MLGVQGGSMKRAILAVTVLSLVVVGDVWAQSTPEPIFFALDAAIANEARNSQTIQAKGVLDRRVVGMSLQRLFNTAGSSVLLNIDGHDWIASFKRLDTDIQGHRAWVGSIDGIEYSHVSFAERDGVVSGLINAVDETYAVRTIRPGVYAVDRVEQSRQELEPIVPKAPDASPKTLDTTAPDDGSVIDVLLLYTPRARTAVGGTSQINAMLAQIISDTNSAFVRSGIATRVRLVGSSEAALPETANMSADLGSLTNDAAVNALRESTRADLVQLIMNSSDASACGVGYLLQSRDNPASFPAFSIADYSCVAQFTPTHEMGHNMGATHAPEDRSGPGLFPYSFGFKNPAAGFRTVMAYNCSGGTCPRILNYSNPAVRHIGNLTGTETQNNALTIINAAVAVSNFRQRRPVVVTPPAPPTGLNAQVSQLTATLSWNPVADNLGLGTSAATGYVLQVGSHPGHYNLLTAPVSGITFSGSAWPGTYYWRVIGTNSAGTGAPSAEAQFTLSSCAAPGAPWNFTHVVGAGNIVTLSWAPPASGAGPFAYTIDVGSGPGLTNLLSAPVGGATSISVAAPSGTFYVRVRAANTCAPSSPPSNERTIAVP
jgi:hypothetical protein